MKRAVYNLIDLFKPVEQEVLFCYQHKMPNSIDVKIHQEKNGKLWAEISGVGNTKDTLFTEAKNRSELEDMVNDAVYTHYDIPYRYSRYLLLNKIYHDPEIAKKKAMKTA